MTNYREVERLKAIKRRDDFFRDPGNGIFFGKERDFVLSNPVLNLWDGIRYDAIEYFERNKISWWQGKNDDPTGHLPTGHLLSSQIACINHLYYLRQRKDIATDILKNLDDDVIEACIVDDGYIEFEFIGQKPYLGEKSFTRGAHCTSVDAVMIGLKRDGLKGRAFKMFLIEWKYTENYSIEDKYIPERAKVYDSFIESSDSPFIKNISPKDLYYEPFYQLMRQTLLAEECVKNLDHNAASYTHIHVVPEGNNELKNNITSPNLKGTDIHDAWKNILKDSSKYKVISPEKFIEPAEKSVDTSSFIHYLQNRYWD